MGALNLCGRPIIIWPDNQHGSDGVAKHWDARFLSFSMDGARAVCELPNGSVIDALSYQIQFSDRD